jgi:hypothetical protein
VCVCLSYVRSLSLSHVFYISLLFLAIKKYSTRTHMEFEKKRRKIIKELFFVFFAD